MARRGDHSREELREMAIQAARAIVARDGLGGVSARAVASAIGYTPGTLYLVFRNLDDLVLHVNACTLDELHAAIASAGAEGTARERVLAIGRAYVDYACEHPGWWSALFERRTEPGGDPRWYRTRIAGYFAPLEEALAALAPGRDAPAVRRAAHAVWAGVNGVCTLGLTGKLALADEDSVHALAELLLGTFLDGWSQA